MASLDSVRQKIFRAILHAQSLETELHRYFDSDPAHMVRDKDSPDDAPTFTLKPKGPMPARFGLIIGDCLQNLRSSLDYLVWELVLATNSQPAEHNMFPICTSADLFRNAVSKRKRLLGVHPDAVAEIEALQPYHLGQDWRKSKLWVIEEFVNINKHRRVLLTMLRSSLTPQMDIFQVGGELIAHLPAGASMPIFDGDAKIDAAPLSEQMKMNAQLLACVTFDEGPAKGMEVTICMNEWINFVLNVLVPKFERFFS